MSRNFFGGGGSGGKKSGGSNKSQDMMKMLQNSRKRKRSMQEMMEDKLTHKVKSHSEMLEDLMDEKMFSTERKPMGSAFFGGSGGEGQEISKGKLAAIEMMRMKTMKKRFKERDSKIKVRPKNIGGSQGGRIDKEGKIYDKKGQVILKVNLETGAIMSPNGLKVGTYDPDSFVIDAKLDRLIEKYAKKANFLTAGAGVDTFGKPIGEA